MFTKEELIKLINDADAVVIGAGAGLSSAAGFEYGGKTFMDNFKYMYDEYGYQDMYSAGFHDFDTEEEKWAYWSKMIYLNRYKFGAKDLYKRLLKLVENKDYFVITTNVDHQFQLAGFDKTRLFYMQGDYGLFQCSKPCSKETYDNKEYVLKMVEQIKDNKIPSSLIPKCPKCGRVMTTNLRCDDTFVEDIGWHNAKHRYDEFILKNKDKKILFLELGVGFSTPVWIKYPFIQMTYQNKNAKYICIDYSNPYVPNEIKNQSYSVKDNIEKYI